MKKIIFSFILMSFIFSIVSADDSADKKEDDKMEKKQDEKKEMKIADLETKMTESGVKYYDFVVGTGDSIDYGDKFECHYTLWFADSLGEKKTRFQSSKDPNPRTNEVETFKWKLGQGLIKGWSDGMVGMREGGTRLLVVSPELGYGRGGRGIPPNTTLVFEIEFIKKLPADYPMKTF